MGTFRTFMRKTDGGDVHFGTNKPDLAVPVGANDDDWGAELCKAVNKNSFPKDDPLNGAIPSTDTTTYILDQSAFTATPRVFCSRHAGGYYFWGVLPR